MKLTEEKCFTYHKTNGLSYLVVKDKMAGRPDRLHSHDSVCL